MRYHGIPIRSTDSTYFIFIFCFQGERRIRVHTMCIPIAKTAPEILNNVDCDAVVALLAKMGEQCSSQTPQ